MIAAVVGAVLSDGVSSSWLPSLCPPPPPVSVFLSGPAAAAAMPVEFELCPGRAVGGEHPCFIIAEIGQNHQGDLEIAKKMIRIVKVAVEFLHELSVPFFKVGSGDTNNLPYIKKTAQKGRPMVISSGMQSMDTMRRVYEIVKPINPNFCILQCTSAYPLRPEDVNLNVMKEYQSAFPDIPIGYSGHESGIAITVAAVALGAKVVERHVTLDKTWKGTDHQASLEPAELAELVRSIRTVEKAMGSTIKRLLPCEMACHNKLGKSVVAKVRIPAGTVLTLKMLTVKVAEPHGFPPEEIFDLEGKTVKRVIEEDETVIEEAIENYNTRTKC
ncbi:N-acetylneuraminate-9-phosphate synthase isoform X2 [Ascaphus truei]|uniref:N-acetylneuraminate-9-phosphate synthase isoform X2 n=1 Tax=Ascaphus truei TaxID=8439 RepID=UPI003F59DCF8